MEIQKFEYLEKEKSFLDETKSIFHNYIRTIIWWKKGIKVGTSFNVGTPFNISVKALQQHSKQWLLTGQLWDKNAMTRTNRPLSIIYIPNIVAQFGKSFVVL